MFSASDFAMGGKSSSEADARIRAKREAKKKAWAEKKAAERKRSMGSAK